MNSRATPLEISESQLAKTLIAEGRDASVSTLRYWRVKGLLPPFVGYHGSGRGRGRKYYWVGTEILSQAKAVSDILQRHKKLDAALQHLWLAGFNVPLVRLRRSLLRARPAATQWTILPLPPQARDRASRYRVFSNGTTSAQAFLSNASAVLCSTFELRGQKQANDLIHLIGIALESAFEGADSRSALLKGDYFDAAEILGKILPAILASNLVVLASDLELHDARRHFRKVFNFLEGALARTVGIPLMLDSLELLTLCAPLYHVILALLHSRQTTTIERISKQIDSVTSRWTRQD